MGVKPREVSIAIDELSLRGVSDAMSGAIAAAVERQLAALIATRGLPPTMVTGSPIELEGGSYRVVAGLDPAAIGEAIASRIYDDWWARGAASGGCQE